MGATECRTIAGPASVTVQGVATVGTGFCQEETADLPLFCQAAPGSTGGRGAGFAAFDSATGGTGWGGGNRGLTINVEYNGELPCLAATLICGYEVIICNDRDLDGTCTNFLQQTDEIVPGYSNEPATDVDCGDGKKDDEKDCADNDGTTLGKTVCFSESIYSGGSGTRTAPFTPDEWNNKGQILVYITNWVGKVTTDPTDANVGAGVAIGTFDVGLVDNRSCEGSDGVTLSTGCIWERDAVSEPGSILDDVEDAVEILDADPTNVNDAVAALASGPVIAGSDSCGNLACLGVAVIVFVIGIGSSTASGDDACPDVGASSPGVPTNVDLTGIGEATFTCNFTWVGVAAGGCITVGDPRHWTTNTYWDQAISEAAQGTLIWTP